MTFSVVIPAYNAESKLGECLKACLMQRGFAPEVIVVDDGSTDDTARIAGTFPVHYIAGEHRGPAAARNLGARSAKGDIIVFTDADCVPESDWLERLAVKFEEGVVAVGGTYAIANPDSRLARMIQGEIAMRHSGFGDEVDFLGSYNLAVRREAFESVGGFDETYTMASGEDNDLSYRLGETGGKLRFAKDARVAHYHPTRLGRYLKTQLWHGFWRVKLYADHRKRLKKGDRYAGRGDLLAPGLILMLGFMFVCALPVMSLSRDIRAGWAAALVGVFALYLMCRARQGVWALRLARQHHDLRMISFMDMVLLRDVARGIGMILGIWVHLVWRGRKGGTAGTGHHPGA